MMPVLDPADDAALRLSISDVAPLAGFLPAARAVVNHLRASSGLSLWMVTRTAGDDWVVLAASDPEPHADHGVRSGVTLTWSDSLCARMVAGHGPRVAPDVDAVPACASAPVRAQYRVGAYLGVPLVGPDGELFGTLCGIDPRPAPATLRHLLPLAELQARLLSTLLAVDLAAEREARAAARPAPGGAHPLLDATAWQTLLEDEERRCAPLADPASVVVLETAACTASPGLPERRPTAAVTALLGQLRPQDAVARTGPRTYAVLLTRTPEAAAQVLASDIVLRMQEAGVEVSCGVAARGRGTDLREAWQRAEAVRRRDTGQAPRSEQPAA